MWYHAYNMYVKFFQSTLSTEKSHRLGFLSLKQDLLRKKRGLQRDACRRGKPSAHSGLRAGVEGYLWKGQ